MTNNLDDDFEIEFDGTFGDVPPGKNALAVMNRTGDTKTIWDPNNADEVASAREQFDRLVATKKFSAFRVSNEDPNKQGQRMTEFDPSAGRIIFVPPVQGG